MQRNTWLVRTPALPSLRDDTDLANGAKLFAPMTAGQVSELELSRCTCSMPLT